MTTWRRHLWTRRLVQIDGTYTVPCECRWYRRLWFLVWDRVHG